MCSANVQDTKITVILGTSHQKGPSVLINTTRHNYMDKHFKNTSGEWQKKSSSLSLRTGCAKIFARHLNSPAVCVVELLIYKRNNLRGI